MADQKMSIMVRGKEKHSIHNKNWLYTLQYFRSWPRDIKHVRCQTQRRKTFSHSYNFKKNKRKATIISHPQYSNSYQSYLIHNTLTHNNQYF